MITLMFVGTRLNSYGEPDETLMSDFPDNLRAVPCLVQRWPSLVPVPIPDFLRANIIPIGTPNRIVYALLTEIMDFD